MKYHSLLCSCCPICSLLSRILASEDSRCHLLPLPIFLPLPIADVFYGRSLSRKSYRILKYHIRYFSIVARYVRFHPVSWHRAVVILRVHTFSLGFWHLPTALYVQYNIDFWNIIRLLFSCCPICSLPSRILASEDRHASRCHRVPLPGFVWPGFLAGQLWLLMQLSDSLLHHTWWCLYLIFWGSLSS